MLIFISMITQHFSVRWN